MSDTPTPPNASDGGDDERISVEPIQLQDEMERSFLDYVEAEAGDAPLDEVGIATTFRHLAREIGQDLAWAADQTAVFRELASGYLPA